MRGLATLLSKPHDLNLFCPDGVWETPILPPKVSGWGSSPIFEGLYVVPGLNSGRTVSRDVTVYIP